VISAWSILLLQLWQIPATLEPRFKEFPVNEAFHGKPAAVVFQRAEERRFRTVIRSGAESGPNFAGHDTIVEWGCGTECFQAAIVDAKTGQIYQPPLIDKERHDFFEASWLHFRRDSNLMIVCVDCRKWADQECAQRYFVWEGDRFSEIHREPLRDPHEHISRESVVPRNERSTKPSTPPNRSAHR
jgi:hypothetical protein